jgi:membrane associated rhomboid family serine protease
MGIYDRDYYRERSMPAGRMQRWRAKDLVRMWSVNTWLIVLCVGIFVIDGFTPVRWMQMSDAHLFEGVPALPQTAVVESGHASRLVSQVGVDGRPVQVMKEVSLIYERPGGNSIGWIEVGPMRFISSYLYFSTALGFLKLEFWRFVGFQFLHANDMHLLFNMIGLFFFGPLVEQYLGSKRFLAFYLLCGLFGALMYLLLNLAGYIVSLLFGSAFTIPGLLFNDPHTPLVGASAGIFGILMAGAFLAPNALVYLFFFLPMRLKTVAYGLVALALGTIFFGGQNAGGEAGHLGGAIAGFYFIRHPHHLHNFFDILGRVDPTSSRYRSGGRGKAGTVVSTAEVDAVLDKITAQGTGSLTDREREILRRYSRRGE